MQNIAETRTKPTHGTREMSFNQNNHPVSHFTKLPNMEMRCEGPGFSLLNMDLPIYMNCPHCKTSARNKKKHSLKFASTVSQLQRIFLVTPLFPTVLAVCSVVQFEDSCLSSFTPVTWTMLSLQLWRDIATWEFLHSEIAFCLWCTDWWWFTNSSSSSFSEAWAGRCWLRQCCAQVSSWLPWWTKWSTEVAII